MSAAAVADRCVGSQTGVALVYDQSGRKALRIAGIDNSKRSRPGADRPAVAGTTPPFLTAASDLDHTCRDFASELPGQAVCQFTAVTRGGQTDKHRTVHLFAPFGCA